MTNFSSLQFSQKNSIIDGEGPKYASKWYESIAKISHSDNEYEINKKNKKQTIIRKILTGRPLTFSFLSSLKPSLRRKDDSNNTKTINVEHKYRIIYYVML